MHDTRNREMIRGRLVNGYYFESAFVAKNGEICLRPTMHVFVVIFLYKFFKIHFSSAQE